MTDESDSAVATSTDQRLVGEWGVVLEAAGVPARIERRTDGWALVVAAADVARGRRALDEYWAEALPAGAAPSFEWGPTRAGLVQAAVLLAAWPFTGFRGDGRAAFLAGEAASARIVDGEVWRAVTALTLHADATHLAGNVVAMGILGTAVCRLLGPGLGSAAILASGVAGNLLNAWLRGAGHVSVGASTAIFGAVGILAGMALVRAQPGRGRAWAPVAAGLALLALLGTGERADLAAHAFGFMMGLGNGMAAALVLEVPPSRPVQWVLAAASAGVVAGAWLLALWR
jgi:membrane associated rhomboid family serine protease